MVVESEMCPVYVDEYRYGRTWLRFAKVAFERYLTLGTDLHGIPSLATQRRNMSDHGCRESSPRILGDKEE